MPCCEEAKFEPLPKGIKVTEHYLQNDDESSQFFAYSAIDSIKFDYIREDRSGTITLCIRDAKSPYAYHFCCGQKAHELYNQIMTYWNST
jgi:hypothetical protein